MESRIVEFKERIKIEPQFCRGLFNYATVRLLAAKCAYYVYDNPYISDLTYDLEEKNWFVMGRALNLISEHETSPCVDWDSKHPLARKAMKLAGKLMSRRKNNRLP